MSMNLPGFRAFFLAAGVARLGYISGDAGFSPAAWSTPA